jgi:hypothetical protein
MARLASSSVAVLDRIEGRAARSAISARIFGYRVTTRAACASRPDADIHGSGLVLDGLEARVRAAVPEITQVRVLLNSPAAETRSPKP